MQKYMVFESSAWQKIIRAVKVKIQIMYMKEAGEAFARPRTIDYSTFVLEYISCHSWHKLMHSRRPTCKSVKQDQMIQCRLLQWLFVPLKAVFVFSPGWSEKKLIWFDSWKGHPFCSVSCLLFFLTSFSQCNFEGFWLCPSFGCLIRPRSKQTACSQFHPQANMLSG